jgi:3-deoxy-D-manno-octulosonic-acid transferase
MSDSAFAGWQRRAALAGEVFKTPHQVMTVDKLQADRFAALGTPQAAIKTGGSLKLPAAEPVIDPSLVQQITSAASGRKILLAASTHKGEEDVVLAAAAKLGAGWMCLLAPRHPHRGREIAARAKGAGVSCARRADGSDPQPAHSLYIVDTLGEMDSLFAVADAVFLGGSLVPRGGHNPIEPVAAGLPVISGPHIFKNQAEFDALAARGLLRSVTDADSLAAAAIAATSDAAAARRLSASARKFAAEAGKRPELAARSILKVIKAAKRDR